MPLYEFYCPDCGNEFEKKMRFDQAAERPACPTCQGGNTKKKLSLFSAKGQPDKSNYSSSSSCGSGRGGFT